MTIIRTRPLDIDSTVILLAVLTNIKKATLRRLEARVLTYQ